MSLAQHVTQAQGFDYDGPAAPNHTPDHEWDAMLQQDDQIQYEETKAPEWQQLNFAPGDFAQQERGPRDAAYKVSNIKRAGKTPPSFCSGR